MGAHQGRKGLFESWGEAVSRLDLGIIWFESWGEVVLGWILTVYGLSDPYELNG